MRKGNLIRRLLKEIQELNDEVYALKELLEVVLGEKDHFEEKLDEIQDILIQCLSNSIDVKDELNK
jgi:hypothetical protein